MTLSSTDLARIEGKLAALRAKTNPITYYGTSSPISEQINAAWNGAYPPAYAPALYEQLHWIDPSTGVLSNTYLRVNDVSGAYSSGNSLKLLNYPSAPVPFSKIGEIYIDDAGGTGTQTFSNIPQIYSDLWLFFTVRDSAAAVSANTIFRVNGLATATYGASYQSANSSFGLGTEQVSQTGWLITSPGNTANRTYYSQGLLRIWDYASTSRVTRAHIRATSLWGATYAAATTTNYNMFGIQNSFSAVTSLSIVSATGFVGGTRFVLFGV
jgi:hypothetical protein